jgi:hypothetical protein
VTAGVIVVTLAQGLVLPAVVRWARLPHDTTVEQERQLAEMRATEEALSALDRLAEELDTDADVVDRMRREFDEHLRAAHAGEEGADGAAEPALRHEQQYAQLRLAVLAQKRATLLRLRDETRIDDTVLRQVQAQLDIEEVRLSRRESLD